MAAETYRMTRDTFGSFLEHLKSQYADRNLTVIDAEVLVEHAGAFVRLEDRKQAEALFLSDVVVLVSSRMVPDYEQLLTEDLVQGCLVTAESQTADIEKKLISGVHGPEVCILVHLQ